MPDGSHRASLEPEHAVNLSGDVARHIVCEHVAELVDGVGLHMAIADRIPHPVFLKMLEIHLVGEVDGGGPGEVFEQLDRQVDGYTVLHAVLDMVEPSVFEEEAVGHADVVLRVGGIAQVEFAIPAFLP